VLRRPSRKRSRWGPCGVSEVGHPWREAVSYCPFVFVEQAIQDRSTLDALVGRVRDGVWVGWGERRSQARWGRVLSPQPVSGR